MNATGTNLGARDPEADEWKDGDDEDDDANDGSFSPALYSGDDDDDEVGGWLSVGALLYTTDWVSHNRSYV